MKRNSIILNLVLLVVYFAFFSLLILLLGSRFGESLIRIETQNIHVFLEILGVPNVLLGNMVYLPSDRLSFEITWQCSGMFSISLYTIIYLSLPGIRKDIISWIFGVSFLYILNLLRIVAAVYLYHHFGENAFSFFHYVLAPAVMFGVVIILLGYLLVKNLGKIHS